jgi:hypothetical protein
MRSVEKEGCPPYAVQSDAGALSYFTNHRLGGVTTNGKLQRGRTLIRSLIWVAYLYLRPTAPSQTLSARDCVAYRADTARLCFWVGVRMKQFCRGSV